MKTYDVEGKKILLVNLNGQLHAIGAICSHEQWDLSWGALAYHKGQIVCGGHGAVFDIETGKGIRLGKRVPPEPVYPVKVQNGKVFLKID